MDGRGYNSDESHIVHHANLDIVTIESGIRTGFYYVCEVSSTAVAVAVQQYTAVLLAVSALLLAVVLVETYLFK